MTRPLGVGIVGCGFAASRHLPAIAGIDEAEIVALADIDGEALERVADAWNVQRRYRDGEELCRDPGVEAVAVCVPAAHHVPVALAALDADRHVLVEKPLALSLHEADRLLERATTAGVKTTMGFNMRSHRLVRRARELLRSGRLGRVVAFRALYSDPILSRPDLPEWRRRRRDGGGSVLEKGVHHFDLARHLLGDEIEEVSASSVSGRGEDQVVTVTGRTERGTLLDALFCDSTAVRNEISLYGEEGVLHLDCYRTDGLELRSVEELPGSPATRVRRMADSLRQLGANVGELRRGGAFDCSYDAEWRHFAGAVRGDIEPASTLEDGRRALQVVLAVLESSSTGRSVAVNGAPSSVAELSAPAGETT